MALRVIHGRELKDGMFLAVQFHPSIRIMNVKKGVKFVTFIPAGYKKIRVRLTDEVMITDREGKL